MLVYSIDNPDSALSSGYLPRDRCLTLVGASRPKAVWRAAPLLSLGDSPLGIDGDGGPPSPARRVLRTIFASIPTVRGAIHHETNDVADPVLPRPRCGVG